jgi:hypothetical protein
MKRAWVTGAVAALTLAAASSACAASVTELGPVDPDGLAGPRLAGERVVWATGDHDGAWTVFSSTPGGTPATLATSPAPPRGRDGASHRIEVFASPDAVAYTDNADILYDTKYNEDDVTWRRLVARLGDQPFATLQGCDTVACYPCRPWLAAIDGTRVAQLEACSGSPHVVVRDLARPGHETELLVDPYPVNNTPRQLALAGDRVAWSEPGDTVGADRPTITVADLQTGEHRVAWTGPHDGAVLAFDLRDDGALAAVVQPTSSVEDDDRRLIWIDPRGTGHLLANRVRDSDRIRFVGDRIAAVLGSGKLSLVGLDGSVQPIAPLDTAYPADSLDYDGTRVTWSSRRCGFETIHVAVVTEITAPEPTQRTPRCPAPHVASTALTVHRHNGRLRVRIACLHRCSGQISIALGGLAGTARASFGYPGRARPYVLKLRVPSPVRAHRPRRAVVHLIATMDKTYFNRWRHVPVHFVA